MKYSPKIVEAAFVAQGVERPVFEHRFHPKRKWRFDIAWPDFGVAIEVQGGIWRGGRHARAYGMKQDWDKHNHAILLNWRIYYCEPKDLLKRETIADVVRLIQKAKEGWR